MNARKGAGEPPVVVYEDVRKLYGSFVALDGITVQEIGRAHV